MFIERCKGLIVEFSSRIELFAKGSLIKISLVRTSWSRGWSAYLTMTGQGQGRLQQTDIDEKWVLGDKSVNELAHQLLALTIQ